MAIQATGARVPQRMRPSPARLALSWRGLTLPR